MASSELRTPNTQRVNTLRAGKRRRIVADDDGTQLASQVAHARELNVAADTQYYDPDQDMQERRAVRKGFRDLTRDLNESRTEFLAPGDSRLVDTLHKANEFFSAVKQTSDATLDSRLLVSAADLSYKKATQLTLGDTAQGIDVDEFVSKCITFMRRGADDSQRDGLGGSFPRRRRYQGGSNIAGTGSDAEGDVDEEDPLNWDVLGRKACFPHNSRPPVPGFLLGPLSLQKRTRAVRTGPRGPRRREAGEVVKPQELDAADLERAENSNLTILCTRIREVLVQVQRDGQAAVEEEASEDMSVVDAKSLMEKYGICDDGGVGFFQFILHPRSFGQTIENLFYVSFLIRDGSVGVGADSDHFPTLHATQPRKISEIKEQGIQKHQAVFSLDWKTWRDLIDAFDITRPLIPDRSIANAQEGAAVGAKGWYA
ncbi:MAG: nuclear protein [Phylliscum demangeonii]|nr:MAG: nuclear protein [Phylliscum demangeonii]